MVHVSGPVGTPAGSASLATDAARRLARQQSLARVMWSYRTMLFNPRYRAIGLIDLPRYVFGALVAPWLELACLIALPFAALAGVLTFWQLVLVCAAVGLGNGVRLSAAMLIAPWPRGEPTMARLLALAPIEVFVARPAELYSKLLGLFRVLVSRPGPASA
jgi:hypothetical protein